MAAFAHFPKDLLTSLSAEVLYIILSYLPAKSLLNVSECNRRLRDLCQNCNPLWKHLCKVKLFFRHAVSVFNVSVCLIRFDKISRSFPRLLTCRIYRLSWMIFYFFQTRKTCVFYGHVSAADKFYHACILFKLTSCYFKFSSQSALKLYNVFGTALIEIESRNFNSRQFLFVSGREQNACLFSSRVISFIFHRCCFPFVVIDLRSPNSMFLVGDFQIGRKLHMKP